MKIKKIKIKNYIRLALSNITYLEYTPEKFIQLILGQNGSGKSSLLLLLSPLPPDLNKDFEEDGYKEIEIIHNDSTYVLISMKKGNKHHFIKDGKNLNDGNTKKVQLKLVEEHFKITPDVMDVLLGSKLFTNMSVAERKNWLTKISDVDYNYSISLFLRMKTRLRDITGGLRILNNKLTLIEKHDLTEKEIKELRNEHKLIMDVISFLLESKSDVSIYNGTPLKEKLDTLNGRLTHLLINDNVTSNEKLSILLQKTMIKQSILLKEKEHMLNTLEKIKEYKKLDLKDNHKINVELKTLKEKLNILEKDQYIFFENIDESYRTLDNQYTDISSVLLELDNLKDVNNTTEYFSMLNMKIKNKLETLRIEEFLLTKNNTIKESLEEAKSKDKITCTNCGHKWFDKYDEETYLIILDKIKKNKEKIVILKNEITPLEEEVVRVTEKRNAITHLNHYLKHPTLFPILEFLYKKIDNFYSNPIYVKDELFKILTSLKKWHDIPNIKREIDKLENKLIIIEKNSKNILHIEENDEEQIEEKLNIVYLAIKENTIIIDNVHKDMKRNDEIKILFTSIKELLRSIKKETDNDFKRLNNEYLNDLVIFYREKSTDIEIKIREYEFTEKTLFSLKNEINDLENRKKVLTLLLKELSPNEGLIAKSIMNFLRQFTVNMNELISTVWSYDMEVLPCDISEKDLDYKFPVLVNNNIEIVDVSKTSSGMQEIINLAFKIASMYYLGIETYPLYLDEYGRNLSIEHREKAFNIHNTLSSFNFSQIYIISHFQEQIIRMNNDDTDTIILGDESVYTSSIDSFNKVIKFIE